MHHSFTTSGCRNIAVDLCIPLPLLTPPHLKKSSNQTWVVLRSFIILRLSSLFTGIAALFSWFRRLFCHYSFSQVTNWVSYTSRSDTKLEKAVLGPLIMKRSEESAVGN